MDLDLLMGTPVLKNHFSTFQQEDCTRNRVVCQTQTPDLSQNCCVPGDTH